MIRTKTNWAISLAVVVCLWAGAAHAAAKRAGVPAFDGVQEALVRKKVMAVLQAHGFELVKSRQIDATLKSLGTRLDSNDGFQALAKELGLSAIVTGEVGKKRAKIVVYDGREGSALGDATFAAANPNKLAAEIGRNFWKKLGAAVQKGRAPSNAKKAKVAADTPEDTVDTSANEEEPAEAPAKKAAKAAPVAAAESARPEGEEEKQEKPEKKEKHAKKEKDAEESGEPGPVPPTLDVSIGPRGVSRDYAYNQPVSKLRPYKLGAAFAVAFNAIWYPISYLTDGFMQHLGLELHIEHAFAISSAIGSGDADFPNGAKFNTQVHDYSGGLRFRVPFAGWNQFYLSATGGEHAFVFRSASSDPTMSRGMLDIPDVIYHYVRPALGIRLELPFDLSLDLAAGYRVVLNGGGQIKDVFFPHLSVGGVDAGATLGWRFMPNWEVRVSGDIRRYFFAMNSKLEDQGMAGAGVRIAGGAIDQYVSGTLSIAYLMGGTEPNESAAAAPAPKKRKAAADEESGGGEAGGDEGGDDEK